MSLKEKAVKGFSWSVFEGVFSQGVLLIVGIVLARLLSPEDFGIIGIVSVFVAVSSAIVDGGFASALIQKIDTTKKDYNTVFYTNLLAGCFLYALLFLSSNTIATYFNEPILEEIFKYIGAVLVIGAFSIIQRTLLIKKLDFKTQAIISIIASIVSGIISIILAYNDYGVWSLVVLTILKPLVSSVLLWIQSSWYPSLEFSKTSFKELFNFGYKLLLTTLINTIYRNIYYVLIGKIFNPIALGYYTRADQFRTPFSNNLAFGIRRISFPILSSLQDDDIRLKSSFRKFIKFSVFLNFTTMLAIAAVAKPLVLILIGEKWEPSIIYLQLLCISGMLYPLQILNLNLLVVKGYSDLNLRLEIIKKIILIPIIYFTALYSIKMMIYGLILFSVIEFFINSYYTNKLIKYSIVQQLKDIFPFFVISLICFVSMLLISILEINLYLMIGLQLCVGLFVFVIVNELFKQNVYLEIKNKVIDLLKKKL